MASEVAKPGAEQGAASSFSGGAGPSAAAQSQKARPVMRESAAREVATTLERVKSLMGRTQKEAQAALAKGGAGKAAIPRLKKQSAILRDAMKSLDRGKVLEALALANEAEALMEAAAPAAAPKATFLPDLVD